MTHTQSLHTPGISNCGTLFLDEVDCFAVVDGLDVADIRGLDGVDFPLRVDRGRTVKDKSLRKIN